MQTSDHDMRLSGDVIPFQPKDGQPKKGQTKKSGYHNDCSVNRCDHFA